VPEDMARPLGGRRRGEATALPGWIKPQLTKLLDQPPDGPEWLHEIKFDGYRMHAEGTMQRSTTRIRTSHVGRLPSPKGWEDMPGGSHRFPRPVPDCTVFVRPGLPQCAAATALTG
jgi:hypothetical protein